MEHAASTASLVERKFGEASRLGFQPVPNVLARSQAALGLDATDMVILLNVMMHWWEPEEWPYPRLSVIAKRMNVTRRTVERRIHKMTRMGLIRRLPSEADHYGRKVRRFDLSGLIDRLKQIASSYKGG